MKDLQKNAGFMSGLVPSATLAITAMANELKAQGRDICSMSAGEPDFDTPEPIKEACIRALRDGKVKYLPTSGLPELRKLIAEKLVRENGIASTQPQVAVGPGAKFSLFSAIAALCGPGDEVLLPSPYWLSYPEMISAVGARMVPVPTRPERNFEPDPAELEAAVTENTRLLILNSPSNPTGVVYRRETLEAIAEIAVRRNLMVLSDEIYEKLIYDESAPHISIGSLNPEINNRTVTVNGFSKTYAMTGWRLGYLSAPQWLAKRVIALQSHVTSNATTFAQFGALAALRGEADKEVRAMCRTFGQRRNLICDLVGAVPGIHFTRPQGAFYLLCDISSFGIGSESFCERLLKEELLAAIPCRAFGDDGCIRLSYACSAANIRTAAQRLGEFCAKLA